MASATTAPAPAPVAAKPLVPFMVTGLAEADIEAAVRVLRSGMLRASTKCAELESRLAEMTQAKHAMTCANGTVALQLAYEPLFPKGSEVLVPSWTFIATAAMVVARGCTPIFVDADPATGQMDVKDAERRITSRTSGIAATHLYGCPVDIDALDALAEKKGLPVVYDAAQAILATYKGKGLGQFGDAVTYSFYATKNFATGEGGMLTVNDDALASKIKLLRSHGETDKYLHGVVGYNYRMNDIAGAIGCSRLDRLERETALRQAAAARYGEILAGIPGITPLSITPGATSVYHLYTVRMDTEQFRCTRDEFVKALAAEGVPTAVHYPRTLPQQPAFAEYLKAQATNTWPGAETLSKQVFCLPMHHALSDEHLKIVGEAISRVAMANRA